MRQGIYVLGCRKLYAHIPVQIVKKKAKKHYIIQIPYNYFTLAELKFPVIFFLHKQIHVEKKYGNPNEKQIRTRNFYLSTKTN